ncbi:MAG: hypothetical protein CVU44_02130 [Chloroflexi bacterium HGW-Chloroflexi-6]|nr:MAG: hypothetical protein CVU44_02130 [Chloroflexi bacterium HGW-Chloroflexi-6]
MTTNNPYVGPRSFSKTETLYGRDRELRVLTDRLIAERIVLLHAPSGAGKTSLVQAGLIPELALEGFFVHPTIRVNAEFPADLVKPSDSLSDAKRFNRFTFSTLLSLEERYPPEQRTKLSRLARLSLADYLALRSIEDQREGPEFLIFDQFEEILSIDPNDRVSKNSFFTQLRTILRNRNRWALFVMRTDYVGALEPYARNIPTYFANTFHLELLGAKAAQEAIQQPAKKAGVDFTDDAAQKLVDDLRRVQVQAMDGSVQSQLGLYIEPVQLQVVCYRLWENKDADRMTIDEQDLASVGDVNQSLAGYYAMSVSRAAEAIQIPERSIREWFDQKLITPEGTRSLVRIGIDLSEGLPNEVIRNIETTHLIRPEKRAGQIWYELAHDRLIEPVRSDNKRWFESNLNLFQRQSKLWIEQGRGEGLLLRSRELDIAEQEAKSIILTPEESAFLGACRSLRQREMRDKTQRRLIVAGLVISLLLFFVAMFFSISATAANRSYELEAIKAKEASTQAVAQQSIAQAASTQAIAQQSTAQAASTQAVAQQATAEAASAQALANANAAATAQADAEIEKTKANEQEKLALEQKKLARANELAAQSILAQNNGQNSVAYLLAAEAFQIVDTSRTRIQLLSLLNARGRVFLTVSSEAGLSPHLSFARENLAVFSSSFDNCEPGSKYYLCRDGVFKAWQLKNISTSSGLDLLEITQAETFSTPNKMLDAISLSPDGKLIAAAYCTVAFTNIVRCEKESLLFWDTETYTRVGDEISIATNSYNSRNVLLAYSPDGKTLAVAINDNTVLLLETQTYTEKARFEALNGVSQLAFSPDGKTLALAGGYNNALTLIDMDQLESKAVQIPSKTRAIISLAYSPSGKQLALGSSEGLILLWDVAENEITAQIYDRQGRVLALAFSPDGKILAAGHDNFYLTLWDVASRQPLTRPYLRHTDGVHSLAFSSDGNLLASAGNEIVLWDLSPESWLKKACNIAGRNFTQIEWQQFFSGEEYRLTCPTWPAGK